MAKLALLVAVAGALVALVLAGGCHIIIVKKKSKDGGTVEVADCTPCISGSDCPGGACVQIGSDDACGSTCASDADCADGQACSSAVSSDGENVQVCIPKTGSCDGAGCGTCNDGQICDTTSGDCVDPPPPDGCGDLAAPGTPAQCHSCTSGDCQANGCYGGWFCNTTTTKCAPPPSDCGGNFADAPDAGPITGSVDVQGGTVSRLFFAVVGDTRPPDVNQTSQYPTSVINQIYADMDALDPRPQFVVATGDYMFASKNGTQNAPQLQKYAAAMAGYHGGPVFPVLGNHECTGYTADNCATTVTQNLRAYRAALTDPLGLDLYYAVPFQSQDGTWTAKLVVAACNAWDQTQKSWLAQQLAVPTTYTIVARHEPSTADTAPCVTEMDQVLSSSTYDLLLVGHTHTFNHHGKEIVVGNGGAPITGSASFGFATVELIPGTGFRVSQIDASSQAVVRSFVVSAP